MRWWQFGLFGGVVLSLATGIKVVRAVIRGVEGEAEWGRGMRFAAAISRWASCAVSSSEQVKRLHRRFNGRDAIVGLAVMVAFFIVHARIRPGAPRARFSSRGANAWRSYCPGGNRRSQIGLDLRGDKYLAKRYRRPSRQREHLGKPVRLIAQPNPDRRERTILIHSALTPP